MIKKKALVTGGTRGIGAASAQMLFEAGYEVFVSGTSPDGPAPKGCAYLACDFSDASGLEVFGAQVAKLDLDVLVNNAGINKIGPLSEYDSADFSRIQQVNVMAPFVLSRAVVPGMQKRRHHINLLDTGKIGWV